MIDRVVLDLSASSFLFAGLVYTAFLLRLVWTGVLGSSSRRITLLSGAAVASSAVWAWFGLAAEITGTGTIAARLFDLSRYGFWFAILLSLISPPGVERKGRGENVLASIGGLVIVFGFIGLAAQATGGVATPLWSRAVLYEALALPVFGLILVEQTFRNLAEDSRWAAKPLCLGLSLIFAFDLYLYSQAVLFSQLNNDSVSIRGIVHGLAVPFFYIASLRGGGWLSRIRISRAAAFHSTALLLAGAYLLCVAAIGYYIRFFGGTWGAALQLVALVAALAFLAMLGVSGAMRSRLRVLVGKHFFTYRFDYREEWLRFTAMLSVKSSPNEMGMRVIRGMADMVESPAGTLWLRTPEQSDYVQVARWNMPEVLDREVSSSAFSQFLFSKGWVLNLEEYRNNPERYENLVLPTWLTQASRFWLIVPLIVSDEPIGFVALGLARTRIDVNWEVTDLLKTASRQAAGFLAQMQATEALLEARKFDAFNRMSAFVVHDLKNIVTQLSLMLKNAKRLHDNPEFQHDMLLTVENSLEKMRQLMLQLRDGKAPLGGQGGVDLEPIVRRIEAVASQRGRTLELQLSDAVVTRGHEERIERVLGHLVQNAFDATTSTDRVWLKLRRLEGQAQVEIGDTGPGMSQEYVQTRLFKPFQSTKAAGMGIGVYESYQYVRELGGNIAVDSQPGNGTVMKVALPLFK